jgi:hypothetical protein
MEETQIKKRSRASTVRFVCVLVYSYVLCDISGMNFFLVFQCFGFEVYSANNKSIPI